MSELHICLVDGDGPRRPANVPAVALWNDTGVAVDIVDVSLHGMQIATERPLAEDDRVQIWLPGRSNPLLASVRWVRDGRAGLRFAFELLDWELDLIAP